MAITPEQYQEAGLALLPSGPIWNKDKNSVLGRLVLAFSDELARIDNNTERLLKEVFPANAFMLLSDWEAFAGLTARPEQTIEMRRQALASKLKMTGSLCIKFFEQLAAEYGYDIKIIELYPHHANRHANYPIYPQDNWHRVFIDVVAPFAGNATALDHVNTPLKIYDYADIAAILDRYKPAHIEFIYIAKEK